MRKLFCYILLIFIMFLTILCGCNAKHCIKYENDQYGNFEYCYDANSSEIEGTPVFSNDNNDSLIAVEDSFLDKIKNTLINDLLPSTLNYSKRESKSKLKELKNLLDELERRQSFSEEK